ncbi:MAG TPA: hypothetical protein VK427_18230, partial [Kofleriaceae bacterium]|nr:hypothetical protein [Kofleriaceae bacterium]
ERLGKGRWVAAMTAGNVYLVPAFLAQPAAARDAALDAAAQALRMITNVAAAGRVDRACTERGELSHAVCLSTFPAESGELYVVPVAGSLISDYKTGTHHDAPFADNRNVPIVVMGPGISPREGKGTLLQVAPTVTSLLGVPAPRATSERPLFDLP